MIKPVARWLILGYLIAVAIGAFWRYRYVLLPEPRLNKLPVATITEPIFDEIDVVIVEDALLLVGEHGQWTQTPYVHCVSTEPKSMYCALALAAKRRGKTIETSAGFFVLTANSILLSAGNDGPSYVGSATSVIRQYNDAAGRSQMEVTGMLKRTIERAGNQ